MPVNATNEYLNWKAPDFNLLSVDEKYYKFNDLKGKNGTVIFFICNHCPYVVELIERLVFETNELLKIGISSIAIMSNDTISYPEDSYENMKLFSSKYQFNFHYLLDKNQNIAKNYGAVCTPDIFGFNKYRLLKYRGRLDSIKMKDNNDNKDTKRDLFYAMKLISKTNEGPMKQISSFGCSIKWI